MEFWDSYLHNVGHVFFLTSVIGLVSNVQHCIKNHFLEPVPKMLIFDRYKPFWNRCPPRIHVKYISNLNFCLLNQTIDKQLTRRVLYFSNTMPDEITKFLLYWRLLIIPFCYIGRLLLYFTPALCDIQSGSVQMWDRYRNSCNSTTCTYSTKEH